MKTSRQHGESSPANDKTKHTSGKAKGQDENANANRSLNNPQKTGVISDKGSKDTRVDTAGNP